MQNQQQFEQLMMQYNQLKNGSEDIRKLIEHENFDEAISMIKARESIFLNCKCMRKYLELTEEQNIELNNILEELRDLELSNIKLLEKNKEEVLKELKQTQKAEKIQQAYEFEENQKGSIVNYTE